MTDTKELIERLRNSPRNALVRYQAADRLSALVAERDDEARKRKEAEYLHSFWNKKATHLASKCDGLEAEAAALRERVEKAERLLGPIADYGPVAIRSVPDGFEVVFDGPQQPTLMDFDRIRDFLATRPDSAGSTDISDDSREPDWKRGVLVKDVPENEKPYHGPMKPRDSSGVLADGLVVSAGNTLVDQMPDEYFDEDHSDENPIVRDKDLIAELSHDSAGDGVRERRVRPEIKSEIEILQRLADGDRIVFSEDGDAAWFANGDQAFVDSVIINMRSKGYLLRKCDDEENYRGKSEYDTISDHGRQALTAAMRKEPNDD